MLPEWYMSDKLCIVRLKAVVRGVPQSLGHGKDRGRFLCGFGQRWFGCEFDGQSRRQCLRCRGWLMIVGDSRICAGLGGLCGGGRRGGRSTDV